MDLGQQRGGRPQRHSPPTTTRPTKSRHTQTQPINLSKEQDHDTQAGRTGRSGLTPCESVGVQASETVGSVDVSVNTDTVDDNTISVDNNESERADNYHDISYRDNIALSYCIEY